MRRPPLRRGTRQNKLGPSPVNGRSRKRPSLHGQSQPAGPVRKRCGVREDLSPDCWCELDSRQEPGAAVNFAVGRGYSQAVTIHSSTTVVFG